MLSLSVSWYWWDAWFIVVFSSPFLSPPAVWAPARQNLWPLKYFPGESGAIIWNLTLNIHYSSRDICVYQAHSVRRLFSTSVVFDLTVSGFLTFMSSVQMSFWLRDSGQGIVPSAVWLHRIHSLLTGNLRQTQESACVNQFTAQATLGHCQSSLMPMTGSLDFLLL